jgi:hypothetical protein
VTKIKNVLEIENSDFKNVFLVTILRNFVLEHDETYS